MQWLQRQGTVEEFEQEALHRKSGAFAIPIKKVEAKFRERPFGNLTDEWKKFTDEMEAKDELWFFSSPAKMFSKKLGCNGYAIVRDGAIHSTLVMLRT